MEAAGSSGLKLDMLADGQSLGGPRNHSEHVLESEQDLTRGVSLGCRNAQRRFAARGDLNWGSASVNEEHGNPPFVQGDGGHKRRPVIVEPWFHPMPEAAGEEGSHTLAGPCADGQLELT